MILIDVPKEMEALITEGVRTGEALTKLGISRCTVERRIKQRYGINYLTWATQVRVQAAKRLHAEGLSEEQISEKLNYSVLKIKAWLKHST